MVLNIKLLKLLTIDTHNQTLIPTHQLIGKRIKCKNISKKSTPLENA